MDLSGKRVLITAAAQGIGLASVQAYLAAGAEVFAADINASALDALEGTHNILLDVTNAQAIEQLANELGPLDVLFHCAGVVHRGTILACSAYDWAFAL
ncbi:SDR family NAD(P)-dependent oxidoreductase, partial [Pseudomonas endophytica]|uniref:SDR family NAD(P)-dependent oxidoreductase n=1 Tax=Pseudomonas endophytica TaxID=1563157 RepID=UPI000AD15D2E